VKTSAAIESIDRGREVLRYFHNTSLHELGGEDYRGAFRLDEGLSEDVLPPYTELVRFDDGAPLRGEELRRAAVELLRRHLARRPRENPFLAFGRRLDRDLPELLRGDAAHYHAYAFATARMAGAAFELLAAHVGWALGADEAVRALARIVEGTKTLVFKLARRRSFETEPLLGELAAAWDDATGALERALA